MPYRHSSSVVVCLCFFFLLGSAALAADFTGSVVSVLDGDTIEVLHHHHPERIRLNGINCPDGQTNAIISQRRALWFDPSPPTIRLPARLPCPSRFGPTVAPRASNSPSLPCHVTQRSKKQSFSPGVTQALLGSMGCPVLETRAVGRPRFQPGCLPERVHSLL